ncbi:MAG: SRPBCC family protein [Saprospiraceae bacterium]
MKILKNLLIGLLGLIVLLVLVSFLLPSKSTVDRSIVINSPSATVYEQVVDLRNWEKWSAWYEMEPTATWKYSDPAKGKAAWYSWDGELIRQGKLTITETNPEKSINTKMDFGGNGDAISNWTFKEKDGTTEVTWAFETEHGMNPQSRWMGLFMDSMLGDSFEQGLTKMKKLCESLPAKPVTAITTFETGGVQYVGVRAKVKMENISKFYEKNFPLLGQHLGNKGLTPKSMPRGIFYVWDEKNGVTDMAAAMAISDLPDLSKPLKKIKMEGGEVAVFDQLLVCDYYGEYDGTVIAHEAMDKWLKEQGKTQTPPVMEEYVTDPMQETDPKKWLTKIYYPYEN